MKYTGTTIIQIAQERGSAAKTKSGAWKYLLAHLPRPSSKQCSDAFDHRMWRDNRWHRRADGRARILGYPVDWHNPCTPGNIQAQEEQESREREADRYRLVARSEYGSLTLVPAPRSEEPQPEIALYHAGIALVIAATSAGVIDQAYDSIEFDRRGRASGTALHHDLYDAAPGAAIVCLRRTEGSRYGVSTKSKTYVLLVAAEDGEFAARTLTFQVAKYAKQAVHLGGVIAHARGEITLSLAPAPIRGYKALALGEDGGYRSVWDRSAWPIGQPRIQRARAEHAGGFYYYRDLNQLIASARRNEIFGAARNHRHLAVVEVIAEGSQIAYEGGKYAATRITIGSHVCSIL